LGIRKLKGIIIKMKLFKKIDRLNNQDFVHKELIKDLLRKELKECYQLDYKNIDDKPFSWAKYKKIELE
jgi:hypothetical protein